VVVSAKVIELISLVYVIKCHSGTVKIRSDQVISGQYVSTSEKREERSCEPKWKISHFWNLKNFHFGENGRYGEYLVDHGGNAPKRK